LWLYLRAHRGLRTEPAVMDYIDPPPPLFVRSHL